MSLLAGTAALTLAEVCGIAAPATLAVARATGTDAGGTDAPVLDDVAPLAMAEVTGTDADAANGRIFVAGKAAGGVTVSPISSRGLESQCKVASFLFLALADVPLD